MFSADTCIFIYDFTRSDHIEWRAIWPTNTCRSHKKEYRKHIPPSPWFYCGPFWVLPLAWYQFGFHVLYFNDRVMIGYFKFLFKINSIACVLSRVALEIFVSQLLAIGSTVRMWRSWVRIPHQTTKSRWPTCKYECISTELKYQIYQHKRYDMVQNQINICLPVSISVR